MSVHSINGKRPQIDIRQDRISAGTLGGEYFIPKTTGGRKVSAIVDDADLAITYGLATGTGYGSVANFNQYATQDWVSGGSQTIIGSDQLLEGAAAQYTFKGTSIAVLGATNPESGNMRVFIDGEETAGRIPVYTGINIAGTPAGTAPVLADDVEILTIFAGPGSFATSGTLYIGGELITYTSKDNFGFYGCTRGALGTTARDHLANETIYQWASAVGLYTASGASHKQILYYNPLLSEGTHTITIVTERNATNGKTGIYFDGFITNPILGSASILTQTGTITFTGNTDANGHWDIGTIGSINNDSNRIAFVGYTQTSCESSNTTAMSTLGLKHTTYGTAYYYLHNGPPSAAVTIIVKFAYIGETL